jgi:hypothetical protein
LATTSTGPSRAWRRHVLGAYATSVQVERELGFRWDEAESRDGSVVRAFDHLQGPVFLDCLTWHMLKQSGLTPEEAVLRTERVAGTAPDAFDVVLPAHPLSAGQERAARGCLRIFY